MLFRSPDQLARPETPERIPWKERLYDLRIKMGWRRQLEYIESLRQVKSYAEQQLEARKEDIKQRQKAEANQERALGPPAKPIVIPGKDVVRGGAEKPVAIPSIRIEPLHISYNETKASPDYTPEEVQDIKEQIAEEKARQDAAKAKQSKVTGVFGAEGETIKGEPAHTPESLREEIGRAHV